MNIKWIKNSEGKPDAMLTFACLSFAVVTLNVLLSTLGDVNISTFQYVFALTSIVSIPANLFDYNTAVTNMTEVFYQCQQLTNVPAHLFDYNVKVFTGKISSINNTLNSNLVLGIINSSLTNESVSRAYALNSNITNSFLIQYPFLRRCLLL